MNFSPYPRLPVDRAGLVRLARQFVSVFFEQVQEISDACASCMYILQSHVQVELRCRLCFVFPSRVLAFLVNRRLMFTSYVGAMKMEVYIGFVRGEHVYQTNNAHRRRKIKHAPHHARGLDCPTMPKPPLSRGRVM